jgi:hypothetical protein
MGDVLIALLFVAMVLSPAVVAVRTGHDLDPGEDE